MKKAVFTSIIIAGFCVFLLMQSPRFNSSGDELPTFAPDIPPPIEQSCLITELLPDGLIYVYFHANGETGYMDFEEYIVGVLAAEMPASFELDALRAQAVAARSFILYRIQVYRAHGTPPEHHGADSCTNFAHCVAWRSIDEARERWGDNADRYESRLREAVESTRGVYMTHDGGVVRAFFFAMSNGRTENVEDVWSANLPYLRSVESVGYEHTANFETQVEIPVTEFVDLLRAERPELLVGGILSEAIGEITHTDGGRVARIQIGNQSFRGVEIRRIFGLRSADFEISTDDEYVYFTVRGFGHGVGMSQHGANALARQGLDWREILMTYYYGVEIP